MSVRINLLPYRKIRRAERQRRFNIFLACTALAGALVVLIGDNYISGKIERQDERNHRLDLAIAKLDKEIAEIKNLKSRISDVLERKRVVENLQGGRGRAVILLDELARQLPEGVYLNSIKQNGDSIQLVGVADTNARVAALVRNLGASQWMESPELVEIHATTTAAKVRANAFTVNVKQKSQQLDAKKK